jgi:hypothetical protein
MDPSQAPKVVVRPQSIKIDAAKEQKFVQDALDILTKTRSQMGWNGVGQYERASWLWRRAVASRRYADDFSDRLSDLTSKLWRVSNKSLNLISVTVDQHKAKLSRDFTSTGFVAIKPRGTEDQNFILKPAEDYLGERILRTRLGRRIKEDGVGGGLIRGESVFKALPNTRTRTIRQQTRVLLHPTPDGTGLEPALDSHGGKITEMDQWITHSDDETLEVLVRDPKTSRPKGGMPQYTEKPIEVKVTVAEPYGSDISFPFWADFVADLDKPDLNQCTIKAHLFEMKPDDLWDQLPKHLLTKAADAYWAAAQAPAGSDAMRARAEQSYYRWKQGEQPEGNTSEVATDNISETRLYAEIWIRYDLDDDRHREDLCLLVDVEAQWPIAYDHAFEKLRSQTRQHPFGVISENPEEKRWYGRGHYSKYHDLAEEIDADLNRLSIEKGKSGNLLFEKRSATEEGRAGLPIEFRSPRTYKLTDQNTGDTAMSVVTVQAQTVPIETSMSNNLTAYMARTGGVTPGDTQGEELAANTATGLQILQEVKNEAVEAIREQMFDGITLTDGVIGLLRLFAELELMNINPGEVKAQFGNARIATGEQQQVMQPQLDDAGNPMLGPDGMPQLVPAMQPVMDPATGMPAIGPDGLPIEEPVMEDITVPIAETLLQWSQTLTPDRIHHMVELVVTRSKSTQLIQTNDNIRLLYEQFIQVGQKYGENIQEIMKPTFIRQLMALEEKDPNTPLTEIQEQVASNPALQQQLTNTEDDPKGGAPGPQGPTPPQGFPTSKPPTSQPAALDKPTITGRPKPTGTPPPSPQTLVPAGI